ncbi:MAG TPA: dihydrolipoamide acetyltransferase family protein [Tepidisphaeraceae bacterium]|jgi:pyruvate dehydrogenase E2 component (dihydrolipoamide acetyltransferase)
MPTEVTMPQMSDTMTEGTIVKWRKKEGDKVAANEVLAEIETDKAVMESESFEAGTLAAILIPEGGKAPVGGVIAVLATGKENPADVKKKYAAGATAPVTTSAPKTESKPARSAVGQSAAAKPTEKDGGAVATLEAASRGEIHEPDAVGHGATRSPAQAVPPVPHNEGNGNGNGHGRIFASPLARRIAADKGIDLHQVKGTGPGGRIVQKDVIELHSTPTPVAERSGTPRSAAPASSIVRETQVVPLTKMRAAIAAALQKSKQQIPHFYETIDVDVEEVSALRARLNDQLKTQNVKLSLADFINKAVCVALLRHPAVNATFDGTNITRHAEVHLGIAVAVSDGLIVPVLKHADKLGLRDMREKSAGVIDRARSGKQKQDEVNGGTFTVSSLGTFGIREFAAIINPPQVAILAVGAAEKRAVVRNDQIAARTTMSLTLSADHRIVDGAIAADFLRTLKSLLEEPGMMLV